MGGRGALLQSWGTYAAKVSRVISDADSAVVMRFWRLGMLGSQRLAKKKGLVYFCHHSTAATARQKKTRMDEQRNSYDKKRKNQDCARVRIFVTTINEGIAGITGAGVNGEGRQ